MRGVGITMVSNFKSHGLERSEGYVKGLSAAQKTAFYKGVFGYAVLSGTARDELDISCSIMLHDGDICKDVLMAIE